MTLTYALIADGGIVLAADTESIQSHYVGDYDPIVVATYKSKKSKLRILKNGSAFSIAGNGGLVDALLAKADLEQLDDSRPFEIVVLEYSRLFRDVYFKAYGESQGPPCAFLFCGYIGTNGKKIPQIVKLSSRGFSWNPVATSEGHGFTGREHHGGALYLHHRLYCEGMPMDSAKCLAYCIVSEVADLDNIVGVPVEMAIVTESGAHMCTDFERYEQRRQEIIETVRSLIHSS
jgi:20S proteasome alpha/beta subunit